MPHTYLYRETTEDGILLHKKNPLRGKPSETDEGALDPLILQEIEHKICQLVTYDAITAPSLDNFLPLKENSECIFAKNARLWGSVWNDDLGIGKYTQNTARSMT